jgi:hypothetical protein
MVEGRRSAWRGAGRLGVWVAVWEGGNGDLIGESNVHVINRIITCITGREPEPARVIKYRRSESEKQQPRQRRATPTAFRSALRERIELGRRP